MGGRGAVRCRPVSRFDSIYVWKPANSHQAPSRNSLQPNDPAYVGFGSVLLIPAAAGENWLLVLLLSAMV